MTTRQYSVSAAALPLRRRSAGGCGVFVAVAGGLAIGAEFDFRLAPDVMTFRDAARHILDAGDGLTGMLLAGVYSFVVYRHFAGKVES